MADSSNNRIQVLDPDSFKTLETLYTVQPLEWDLHQGRIITARIRVRLGQPAALRVEAGFGLAACATARSPGSSRTRHQGLTYELVDGKVVRRWPTPASPGGTLAAERRGGLAGRESTAPSRAAQVEALR